MTSITIKILILLVIFIISIHTNNVGYRIGKVQSYKKLRSYQKSTLYEVQCSQLDDGRPIKLLELQGTHSQVGQSYGYLLGKEIHQTYDIFFKGQVANKWQLLIIQKFLDWQFNSYVKKQLPLEFMDQLKGINRGSIKLGYKNAQIKFQRVLAVSSFPGELTHDIASILFDEFYKSVLGIKNQKIQSYMQDKIHYFVDIIKNFINKKRIHCSFFAVWGNRTQNGNLYTMRNLDWQANTGMNINKIIFVWKIDKTIPHLTIGFPGLIGALTGMSKAGLTVHQAGMSSLHSTEVGFHWTLRLRYIMMYAKNLEQSKNIWERTNNTLGMNYMIGSANDISSGHPALVMETMRGYTAFFKDNDQRQNGTVFIDPKTKKQFKAGFSMPQTVFRTNHAYDPMINKNHRSDIQLNSDTMIRYRILKDQFISYADNGMKIGERQALNLTAILGDKGSEQFYHCPNKHIGINVISVMYVPQQVKMYVAFEYGYKDSFKSACCGVYVQMDMNQWFATKKQQLQQ